MSDSDLIHLTRAAQTAFNKAGYTRDSAYQNSVAIASYLSDPDNCEACRKLFKMTDDTEIAYLLAKMLVEDERARGGL